MRLLRAVSGVVIGFGVFLAGSKALSAFTGSQIGAAAQINGAPGNYLLLSVSWTVAAAILSGYLAARIAGAHEFPNASAVGLLMIGMGFLSMRQEGASQPGWYQITISGCGPISAMIGAAIRLLTKPGLNKSDQTANSNTSGAASRR